MYQCVFSNYASDHRVDVISVNGDTNNLRGPINWTSDIVCFVPNGFSPFTESGLHYHHLIVEIQCSILEIMKSFQKGILICKQTPTINRVLRECVPGASSDFEERRVENLPNLM